MLLSSFLHKKIYENGQYKGVCEGVFLAKKSCAVKGLICQNAQGHFCLPFSQIDYVTDTIKVKRIHPVSYAVCERFYPGLPVYDEKGKRLGETADLEILQNQVVSLLLEDGTRLSAALLSSCRDAVIVKEKPPFPLSCLIPAPAKILLEEDTSSPFVTKRTLRAAVKKGTLIRLTLSLLSSNGVFCGKF